jgi:hypothetical protein
MDNHNIIDNVKLIIFIGAIDRAFHVHEELLVCAAVTAL